MAVHSEAYTYFLQRRPLKVLYPTQEVFPEGNVLFFLRPGEHTSIQNMDTYFSYDLISFRPETEADQKQLDTLDLPTGPCSPSTFFVISSLIKAVYDLRYSADRYQKEKTEAHLQLLLYATASGNETLEAHTPQEVLQHKFRRLRVIIADDPAKKWTVQKAADHVGLSPSRFCVVYKKLFGTTFASDLIRSKIQHSCSLLISTDLSIKEIAQIMNYENNTFFYRQFKQQIGISPGEYRSLRTSIP